MRATLAATILLGLLLPASAKTLSDFGPVGTADDTATIQAALNYSAANREAVTCSGYHVATSLVLPAYAALIGDATLDCYLIQKNATNLNFITSTAHSDSVTLKNMTIDGNRANNSAGDCLEIIGAAPTLENIYVRNCPHRGIHTGVNYIGGEQGGLGKFTHIDVENVGETCLLFDGPSDSSFSDIFLNTCSMVNGSGMGLQTNRAGKFNNLHISNADSSSGVGTPTHGLFTNYPGSVFTGCHIESGSSAANIGGGSILMSGCKFYAPDGQVALLITSNYNNIQGSVGGNADSAYPNYVGVQIGYPGLPAGSNVVDITNQGANTAAINFANSGAFNDIRMRGILPYGGNCKLGTSHVWDKYNIVMGGGGFCTAKQEYP